MSCAYPFHLPHTFRTPRGNILEFEPYQVPCGWCVNCIQDKINYISDRAKWELCHRLSGAFVTFTYDDTHLLTNCLPTGYEYEDLPRIIHEKEFSVRKRDVQKFINTIRTSIKSYNKEHPDDIKFNNVLCQPDFSYIYCTEYGDCFGRPHVHVLFFGLDFAYCKKLIFEKWKFGLIDVLPILDGCINYVCKYMSKQVHGALAYEMYDSKGLERPTLRMSVGFGKGLISNTQDIKSHNMTYACGRGLRRPVSAYWKKLIDPYFTVDKNIGKQKTIMQMQARHLKEFSKHKVSEFRLSCARAREENLKNKLRANGVAVPEIADLWHNKFTSMKFIRDEVVKLGVDVQRWLASDYISHINELTEEAFCA